MFRPSLERLLPFAQWAVMLASVTAILTQSHGDVTTAQVQGGA